MASINPTVVKRQTEEVIDYVHDLNSWIHSIKEEEDKVLNESNSDSKVESSSSELKHSHQDLQRSENLKEEGNSHFQEGRMDEAVAKYTESLALDSPTPSLLANRAMAYITLEKYEEARTDCTRALELDSGHVKAYLRRGAACAKLELFTDAMKDYEKVMELEPWNEEATEELESLRHHLHFTESTHTKEAQEPQPTKTKGSSYFKKNKLNQAIAKHTQSMSLDPSNPQLPTDRALAYIKLEKYEKARIDCTNALNLDPCHTKAYLRRAMAFTGLRLITDAIQDYENTLELEPGNKEAQRELQNLRESSKSVKSDSQKELSMSGTKVKAVKKPIIHGSVPEDEGIIVLPKEETPHLRSRGGNFDPRVERVSKVEFLTTEQKPPSEDQKRSEKLKEEGNLCYKKGNMTAAIAKYTESIELNSTNPLLPANRAMAYLKLEKYEDAQLDCTRALELDSGYIKAYLRRGTACAKLGLLTDAAQDYEKAVQLEPWNKDAKKELEILKRRIHLAGSESTKDIEEPRLSKAEEAEPSSDEETSIMEFSPALQKPSTLSLQRSGKLKEEGNSYYKKGNLKQAIAKYTQSMALDPSNPHLPANRALAYIKLEKYEAACMDCTKALKLDPSYIKAYLRRATIYSRLGLHSDAIHDYEKVLELEPWNKEAQQELQGLKECISTEETITKDIMTSEKQVCKSPPEDEGVVVLPINKPLHLRSQVPLSCVTIRDVVRESDIQLKSHSEADSDATVNQKERNGICSEKIALPSKVDHQDIELKAFENVATELETEEPKQGRLPILPQTSIEELPTVPRTSNQFSQKWNKVHHSPSLSAKYLMSIPLSFLKVAEIEVDHLVEISRALNSSEFSRESATEYLLALSNSPTFSLNVAFLDFDQKKAFSSLLNKLEEVNRVKKIITSLRSDLET